MSSHDTTLTHLSESSLSYPIINRKPCQNVQTIHQNIHLDPPIVLGALTLKAGVIARNSVVSVSIFTIIYKSNIDVLNSKLC